MDFKEAIVETDEVSTGEFFAGGGGVTSGMAGIPGVKPVWLLNHDPVALRTNAYHHKGVKVYWADLYVQDEHEMEYVDHVHASVECDQHCNAKGGGAKDIGSYTMGWELFRYLKFLLPLAISIENVPEYKKWAPLDKDGNPDPNRKGEEFERWKQAIIDLGYVYKETIRNAADDGMPTRRVRFFCFFTRPGIEISFPEQSHSKCGSDGLEKWQACREHIEVDNHGNSIFGRKFNTSLPKHLRKPLCKNSLKRIAGGIKKQDPNLYQFLCKYHAGINPERSYSLDEPIRVIDGSNRHQLVTVEQGQFIQDHCQVDHYQNLNDPLRTQLTWQTKQLISLESINFQITCEKLQFIMDHCHSDKFQDTNEPLGVQTSRQNKQLTTVETDTSFIVQNYGNSMEQSNSLDEAIYTIPCRDIHQLIRVEKMQFIVKYFNSNGNPGANNESLDGPLSPILTEPHHQLITILDNFDIKARFLNREELAGCSTFPRDYFSHKDLKLSGKKAIEMIGNAVPPKWAKKLFEPTIGNLMEYKKRMAVA